jgi:5-aminopentanamidase
MGKYAAIVQMDCETENIEANTKTIIRLAAEIKHIRPETVTAIFPEMCLYGYDKIGQIKDLYTQDAVLKCLAQIAGWCRKLDLEIILGAPLITPEHVENALYHISAAGEICPVFSKNHLIDKECTVFAAGSTHALCDTRIGKAGCMICWDAAFPSLAHSYALEGADLLIISAAWEREYREQWELAVCGAAFYTALPVIASNRSGRDGDVVFCGTSMSCNSMGECVSHSPADSPAVLYTDIEQLYDDGRRKLFGSPVCEEIDDILQENDRWV